MKTLKRFGRMMKRLKPYLPKPRSIPTDRPQRWSPALPGEAVYPPTRGRHVEDLT